MINCNNSITIEESETHLLSSCTIDGQAKLRRPNAKPVTYKKGKINRYFKSDVKPQSRSHWLKRQENVMLSVHGIHG